MTNIQKENNALTALQDKFCIFNLGTISYGDFDQINEVKLDGRYTNVHLYNKKDATLLMKRFLENQSIASNPKEVIEDFDISGNTHIFKEITFSPLPKSSDVLNLWIGPTVEPSSHGSCQIILDFILENICNNQCAVYEYLINYLAHMIQKPEEKPGVMIVLLGGQGIGKGTFFELLQTIWGKTALLVSSIDQVLGRFNGILERNFIIELDEALFSGDKKSAEKLKSLITEERLLIENKYESQKSIASFHRFFAASTKSHFVNVDADDRRFLFLRVSEFKAQNVNYYGDIRASFKNTSSIGAFVTHLSTKDISKFNFRQRPTTSEHITQKIQSLQGFERWWHEELMDPSNHPDWLDLNYNFILSSTLVEYYKDADCNAERYASIQFNQIWAILNKICPSTQQKRKSSKNKVNRGYIIPPLAVARKEFARYLGGEVDWQDPKAADNLELDLITCEEEEDEYSPF